MFKPGQPVLGAAKRTIEFTSPQQAARKSRLAAELFGIEGVSSVLLGSDFISVNKKPEYLWVHLKPQIFSAIMDQFTIYKNDPVVKEESSGSSSEAQDTSDSLAIRDTDSEVVKAIKEILETRIRPVIQGDGGDLNFEGFDEASGTVKLKLQGACRSCASSVVTLKNGIENMLKFYIPEVKEVLQVEDELESLAEKEFKKFEQEHNKGDKSGKN